MTTPTRPVDLAGLIRGVVVATLARMRVPVRKQATVTVVTVGPPKTVTLAFYTGDTSAATARYLASYAPTVGDVVWVDTLDGDPMVIGKLA